MQSKHSRKRPGARLAALAVLTLLALTGAAFAQTETVLWNYTNTPDTGFWPSAMIFDSAGNLYGTNEIFGNTNCLSGCGSVFELSPNGAGGWNYNIIYSFKGGSDGANPEGVVFGPDGSLYGVTYSGGASNACPTQDGCGTVYKLTNNGNGIWTETQLHSFTNEQDGENPNSPLIFDAQGNIYGTTFYGGRSAAGVFYKLSPNSDGTYTKTNLYQFTGGTNGSPDDLIQDAAGNIYVATTGLDLGWPGQGAIEKLAPNAKGQWQHTTLHTFGPGAPGGLAIDASGDIFGVIDGGKNCDYCGTAFELTPSGNGYTETQIGSFIRGANGADPTGLTLDSAGNLYGATSEGGSKGYGVVFKLTKSGNTWTETVLHNFTNGSDGGNPFTGVVLDSEGNIYGGTFYGGTNDEGVLYELTQ